MSNGVGLQDNYQCHICGRGDSHASLYKIKELTEQRDEALNEVVRLKNLRLKEKKEKTPLYEPLPTRSSLSTTGLEECVIRMRPARTYKLFVGAQLLPFAYKLAKEIGAQTRDHPFAPYINVIPLDTLQPAEWFIEGDAWDAWGSLGV